MTKTPSPPTAFRKYAWGELGFWMVFIVGCFVAGYIAAVRPEFKQVLFRTPQPLQILSSDSALPSSSLVDFLEEEIQNPLQIELVQDWQALLGKATQSEAYTLAMVSSDWADQLFKEGLLATWDSQVFGDIYQKISPDFRNPERDAYFLPLFWKAQWQATTAPQQRHVERWGLVQIKDSGQINLHHKFAQVLTSTAFITRIIRDSNWATCMLTAEDVPLIPQERKPSYLRKLSFSHQ